MSEHTSTFFPGWEVGQSPPAVAASKPSPYANAKNGSPADSNASGPSPAIATSRRSRRRNTPDESGFSQGVLPVSRPVSPGSAEARQMTVSSGRKLSQCVRSSSPLGSFLRTLLASTAWASTESFLTWKGSATKSRRSVFQLAPSIARNSATGFGLWATPRNNTGPSPPESLRASLDGQLKAALWPAAASRDTKNPQASQVTLDKNARPLNEVLYAALWPTAQAHDKHAPTKPEIRKALKARTGAGMSNLNEHLQAELGTITSGSSSTAPFTEYQVVFTSWLMGLDLEYLKSFVPELSAPLATQSIGRSPPK